MTTQEDFFSAFICAYCIVYVWKISLEHHYTRIYGYHWKIRWMTRDLPLLKRLPFKNRFILMAYKWKISHHIHS